MSIRRRTILVFCLLCLSATVVCPLHAQQAQNRPYVDDKLFHFGFQLGLNFSSFSVTDSQVPVTYLNENGVEKTDTLHARVSGVLPGFHGLWISATV